MFSCLLLLPILVSAQEFRTIDGVGNNETNPSWGSAGGPLFDNVPNAFEDGYSAPARSQVMNPREISNILFEQDDVIFDHSGLSDFIWAFGQFLDHDITLVHNHPEDEWLTEGFPIVVPDNDAYMTPGKIIPLMRSKEVDGTGTEPGNPRKYINDITAYIDGSSVYGSDENRAEWQAPDPDVLATYRARYRHILVDEFQDTDREQYALVNLLAGTSRSLFIVADDRQSIYAWRSADPDFLPTTMVLLQLKPQPFSGS